MSITSHGQDLTFTSNHVARIQALMLKYTGISLSHQKQQMMFNRLQRLMLEKQAPNFDKYLARVHRNEAERDAFINALTTNLTSFYREAHQFNVLADYLSKAKRTVNIWSAGCSSGEEAYSIAMTAFKVSNSYSPKVNVLATDINSDMLKQAEKGIYPLEALNKLDMQQRKQFFHKGKGRYHGFAKVNPELHKLVQFRKLNLANPELSHSMLFDLIFCRNVLIYFQSDQTQRMLHKMLEHLKHGGLFFVGHAENYSELKQSMTTLGGTVYRKI